MKLPCIYRYLIYMAASKKVTVINLRLCRNLERTLTWNKTASMASGKHLDPTWAFSSWLFWCTCLMYNRWSLDQVWWFFSALRHQSAAREREEEARACGEGKGADRAREGWADRKAEADWRADAEGSKRYESLVKSSETLTEMMFYHLSVTVSFIVLECFCTKT